MTAPKPGRVSTDEERKRLEEMTRRWGVEARRKAGEEVGR